LQIKLDYKKKNCCVYALPWKCVQQIVAFVAYHGNGIKLLHSNGRLPNIIYVVGSHNSKESEYWLNQHSASSRYTFVLGKESEG
jgi:hypothetical protein